MDKGISREELDAIRKQYDAATPGLWRKDYKDPPYPHYYIRHEGQGWPIASVGTSFSGSNHEADGEFIISARQNIPLLLSEIDRLTDLVESFNTEYTRLENQNKEQQAEIERLTALVESMEQSFKKGISYKEWLNENK